MPTSKRPSPPEALQADSDIRAFKELFGPAAAEFDAAHLPQLQRELWAWANFLLDLYASGHYAALFDTPQPGTYDQDNGFCRSHLNQKPKT